MKTGPLAQIPDIDSPVDMSGLHKPMNGFIFAGSFISIN
jgi:hypothetical protein